METIKEYKQMRSGENMKEGLRELCKMLPENLAGIEIGSYAGESMELFMQSSKFSKLYCVDMWSPEYYSGRQLISAEEQFEKVASKYPQVEKVKSDSGRLFKLFSDKKIDFIYIDGNHKYFHVLNDIKNGVAILHKSGGAKILAGHDYGYKKTPDVEKAVKEILGQPDATFCDYSWIKFL